MRRSCLDYIQIVRPDCEPLLTAIPLLAAERGPRPARCQIERFGEGLIAVGATIITYIAVILVAEIIYLYCNNTNHIL